MCCVFFMPFNLVKSLTFFKKANDSLQWKRGSTATKQCLDCISLFPWTSITCFLRICYASSMSFFHGIKPKPASKISKTLSIIFFLSALFDKKGSNKHSISFFLKGAIAGDKRGPLLLFLLCDGFSKNGEPFCVFFLNALFYRV